MASTPMNQNVSISAGQNITLSTAASAFTIHGQPNQSRFMNEPMIASQTYTMGQSSSFAFPLKVPFPLSFNFVRFPMSGNVFASTTGATTATTNVTGSQVWSYNMQIFEPQSGANSLSLSQVMSTQLGMTNAVTIKQSNTSAAGNSSNWSMSQSIVFPMSTGISTYSTSTSSNAASYNFSTGNMTDFSGGAMILELPWATSLAEGDYIMAFGVSSSFATQVAAMSVMQRLSNQETFYGNSQANLVFKPLGAVSNSSIMFQQPLGSFSVVGGATTASLNMTNVSSNASHILPLVAFHRTA